VRTDPRKHFERLLAIGLLQLSLGAPCHASLGEDGDSLLSDSTTSRSRMLKKARRLTRPTLARQDAPGPKQGHIETITKGWVG
jgi:hypothetical protein